MYTWNELNKMADSLRFIRDNYIIDLPMKVIAVLYRNLKTIEQEIRILTEIDNFMKKYIADGELYEQKRAELENTFIDIKIRKVSIKDLGETPISLEIMDLIADFIDKE